MLKQFLAISFTAISIAFATPAQMASQTDGIFKFDAVDLGLLQQGIKKAVEIKGKNISSQAIELESVFNQMTGGENFVYPKKINPGQEFKINFTLSTAYIEGDFLHNIVLVDTSGKAYLAVVKGSVENPIIFNERILDLGFYKKGKQKKWVFYAWNANGKALKFKLKTESQKEFRAEFADVKLDVHDFENIKEGGNTPGVKITLSVMELEQPKNTQKSIRKIVSFICENFPNATPELLVTGYWE
ncbi:MAG: hypothetical protein LBH25_14105 [Fibromonadaceae bacterium]|jgi:hypothetical protein|nr:hypothetical protein [Fibromonadaceae bacterium]